MTGASGELEVSVEAGSADSTVVRVSGELDLATIARLEEALGTVGLDGETIIDLTHCTFLDSSAVHVLANTSRAVDEAGGTLSLVASNPTIVRVLEIAAVDTMMPVHPTLDAAR
ncbi:MAG: STAS domain-containing protein [Gaiellaceae bacterium]